MVKGFLIDGAERAFCVKGISMSYRECQLGLAALCTKAKKVDCRWEDSFGVCPRTLEMRSWHLTSEPMKAAGARMEAKRRLRLPRELGRVAFSQDQSGNGHPVMSEREARIAESKALEALAIYSGGRCDGQKPL